MKKEFNLSAKRTDITTSGKDGTKYHKGYYEEDVKEFIKECEKDFPYKQTAITKGCIKVMKEKAGDLK